MYRYSSGTTTEPLVQIKVYQVKEKNTINNRAYYCANRFAQSICF